MIWNKPGENTLFPSLVTVITCHNPGKLTGHAAEHTRRQKELGHKNFTVVVDRAYNGEKIQNFHFPAARLGLDVVFDYKKDNLGVQSNYKDLMLIDGSWYVNWIPQGLIDVSKEFRTIDDDMSEARRTLFDAQHFQRKSDTKDAELLRIAKDERDATNLLAEAAEVLPSLKERFAMREPYRMIPYGRRDADGYQRFRYPPANKMLAKPSTKPETATVSVPPVLPFNEQVAAGKQITRKDSDESDDVHSKLQPIKHAQRYPYRSSDWAEYYGMRSLVEGSNSLLKNADHGDVENATKRSGRGYAATYLATAYAVVASNLRRIATFFRAEADRLELTKRKHRTRRRTDHFGKPLPAAPADAPPDPEH